MVRGRYRADSRSHLWLTAPTCSLDDVVVQTGVKPTLPRRPDSQLVSHLYSVFSSPVIGAAVPLDKSDGHILVAQVCMRHVIVVRESSDFMCLANVNSTAGLVVSCAAPTLLTWVMLAFATDVDGACHHSRPSVVPVCE